MGSSRARVSGMGVAAVVGVIGVAGLGAPAGAQVLSSNDFEAGVTGGWVCTGWEPPQTSGGNPGGHLHVPLMDWDWVTLGNDQAGTPLIGDVRRHGGALEVRADIRVFTLNNWFNEPMDPGSFPLVLQFVDATDATVSVYTTGPGMPSQSAGWVTFTFAVPDPSAPALPAGWGGTGDEDPVTFEPRLPAGRTYASVMQNVGQVVMTTARPGWFYSSSFWEVGYDNVVVSRAGAAPCYANCDGSAAPPVLNVADFTCFLQKFTAGDAYANCDGSTAAPVLNVADFTCFLQKFAAGCP